MIIDLSHPLYNGMPAYPGIGNIAMEHFHRGQFRFTSFVMEANTGTYIDAPVHRWAEGSDLAGVPLERLADLPVVLIDVQTLSAIGPTALSASNIEGKAVIFFTGWSERWDTESYFQSHHFVTAETANYLASHGAALVGIDCANIDDMTDPDRPAHAALLGAAIPIVEHLRGLHQLIDKPGARFFAVPPAIRGGTSFPVRAFAWI